MCLWIYLSISVWNVAFLPKMKIKSIEPASLSTSDGKILCVQSMRRSRNSHQLVAMNKQEPGHSVKVYHISYDDKTPCMAFGFEVQNTAYFPVVTRGEEAKFKVLPKDMPITERTFDETFLFKWGEKEISGNLRSLESVALPKKYLCVENRVNVTITEEQKPDFKIGYSDEKKDESWQFLFGPGKIQENDTIPFKKISLRRRNLKRRCSCYEGSVAPNKPLRCNIRKTKLRKM